VRAKWLPWQLRLPIATGQLNRNFTASYFINENVYELPNMHMYSSRPPGHVAQFLKKNRSKVKVTRAHKCIQLKYALTQYPTSYSGADISATPQRVRHKMVSMATQVAYQRGYKICNL